MNRYPRNEMAERSRPTQSVRAAGKSRFGYVCVFLLAALTITLSSCGGSGPSSPALSGPQIAGNWQFAMTTPAGDSFVSSPLQGGFLLQKNGSITGQAVFSIVLPPNTICNSGTASITGTVSGQTVNLTATVGTLDQNGNPATQTITLTGATLSSDNLSIKGGAYSFTPGFYLDPNKNISPCGLNQDAGTWSATAVPPLTGAFQGFFHSESRRGQDFPVSGTFVEGQNIGASFATVTGTLLFQDPITLVNDYPCLTTASVNGEISGNSVTLQIYGSNGLVVGQIGGSPPLIPATFDNSTTGGLLLQGQQTGKNGYSVTNKACPSPPGTTTPGDAGNVCLGFASSKGCTQPIVLSPLSLTFPLNPLLLSPPPLQVLGSPPTTQTVTVTNVSGSPLAGVQVQPLSLDGSGSGYFYWSPTFPLGDFNGGSSFTILQTGQANDCTTLAPLGSTFTLQSSCTVTVQFAPQEGCPWMPLGILNVSAGAPFSEPPSLCPTPLTATLIVNTPAGATKDGVGAFSLPISGSPVSAVVPSTGELDFGSEAVGEVSPPQTLTFTNVSADPVQVLSGANTCSTLNAETLPYPPTLASPVAGFQVDRIGFPADPISHNSAAIIPVPAVPPTPATVMSYCDFDSQTRQSNFQIAPAPASSCLGSTQGILLQPQQSCTLQLTFAPQPEAWSFTSPITAVGLDYFLQFNTVGCNPLAPEPNCEIDSGRFPVELKTGPPSPLRMSPAAGVEFGLVLKGNASNPASITLFNDPVDPHTATVNFTAKFTSGDYFETDDCPSSLAPNNSCTITVTFIPKVTGLDPGKLTITYNTPTQVGLVQTIYMRGTGQ